MRFTLTPAPLASGWREAVLSLAQAKAHLRIDPDNCDEDDLITVYRDAAIDHVERRCGVSLVARAFTLELDSFGGSIVLPVRPVIAVQSVGYADNATSGTFADWRLSGAAIVPKPGKAWPDVTGPVTVAFTAGFADPAQSVPGLIAAAQLLVEHWSTNRGAVVTGMTTTELPMAVTMLIDDVRMPVL